MSTNVNVRVGNGQLRQQLKDQTTQTRHQAQQDGTPASPSREERQQQEAAAEAVRRLAQPQGDDGQLKFRARRRQLSAHRGLDEQQQQQLLSGIVPLARVGIRRNTTGTKIFVYPWGIEAALGRKLSDNYSTAVSEAAAVGIELEPPLATWGSITKPPPSGNRPIYSPATLVPGRVYDMTPNLEITSFNGARYYNIDGRWSRQYNYGYVGFPLYDYETTDGYIHYLGDTNPGTNNYVYSTYKDSFVSIRTFGDVESLATVTQEVILPVDASRALYILIFRHVAPYAPIRYYYSSSFKESIIFDNSYERFTNVAISGRYGSHEVFMEDSTSNTVLCVLVDGSTTFQVAPSQELIQKCNELVPELQPSSATGSITTNILATIDSTYINVTYFSGGTLSQQKTYQDITTPAFELSNIPKPAYHGTPTEKQVLAKQFGMGYLQSNNHAGNFITPAIFDWFTKDPTLDTSYAPHISRYGPTPTQANTPFPGFYLNVPVGGADQEVMQAVLTTPTDTTTPIEPQPEEVIEVETESSFGDYLVWDWGNPEYCRERLTQLGMGHLF